MPLPHRPVVEFADPTASRARFGADVCVHRSADVTQPAQTRIPVLIVDGQNSHKWKTTTKVLREALESGGRFMVVVATSPPAGASMEGFEPAFHSHRAVVLNYNCDAWLARTRNAFTEYVRTGGGVVVVHTANDVFPDLAEYNELIGLRGWGRHDERSGPYLVFERNEWKREPSSGNGGANGPQYAFPVRVRAPEHPSTRGMPAEWMHVQDELYSRLRSPARNITVLALRPGFGCRIVISATRSQCSTLFRAEMRFPITRTQNHISPSTSLRS